MKRTISLATLLLTLSFNTVSKAGVYTDDLSRCLVESTGEQEKVVLVKWIFTALANHPEISHMAVISDQQRENANKDVVDLFVTLLTKTCLTQSQKAIKFEGSIAIKQSFTVFGQVAGRELFSDPKVAAGLSELDQYIDRELLNEKLNLSNQ